MMKLFDRVYLKILLGRLERQIRREFDRDLSRRIDAVRFLLEDSEK